MMYAHDKQTPDEREQVRRHWATSEQAWQAFRGEPVEQVEYSTADKLTWWAMAERHFMPGLTTRPMGYIHRCPVCLATHVLPVDANKVGDQPCSDHPPQPVPELDTFNYEPVDVWAVGGRTR